MLANDTELQQMARDKGRCDRCNRPLSIYRYRVNRTLVTFMRAAAEAVKRNDKNDFDVATLGLAYSTRTQLSKLRQHGLVARVKAADGSQLASRWLITRKGWNFLSGDPIPTTVIVFENQVIGHDNGTITIHEVTGEPAPPEADRITPPESQVYSQMREPRKHMKMQAVYTGHSFPGGKLDQNVVYDIEVEHLQVGRPVVLLAPVKREYRDIAAFQKDWKISSHKEGSSAK